MVPRKIFKLGIIDSTEQKGWTYLEDGKIIKINNFILDRIKDTRLTPCSTEESNIQGWVLLEKSTACKGSDEQVFCELNKEQKMFFDYANSDHDQKKRQLD